MAGAAHSVGVVELIRTRPHGLVPSWPLLNLAKVGVEGSNPFARSKILRTFNNFPAYGAGSSPSFLVSEALRKHSDSDFAAWATRAADGSVQYQHFDEVLCALHAAGLFRLAASSAT